MSNKLATTFALSAAALFLGGCGKDKPTTTTPDAGTTSGTVEQAPAAVDPNKKVRCYGANECSGQTACDVKGKWDCAGNNDCCGKGWIHVTKGECDTLGGGPDESFIGKVAGVCEGKPAGEGGEPAASDGGQAAEG